MEMSEVWAVFSPIFGIGLKEIDELELGGAKIFRNRASLPYSQTDIEISLEHAGMDIQNIHIPFDVPVKGAPPAPFDANIRQFGIAKYLIEVGINTPTNELASDRVSEELKWAVLPLRILTPARILTGLSAYCQGGCVSCSLAAGGIKETVSREGILAPAPVPNGYSNITLITREASKIISNFSPVINRHRDVLIRELGVAIDTFSNSFYLPSYTQRGIDQLIVLESLFSERGSKRGIKDKVAKRVANFIDVAKKKEAQNLVRQAFDSRKDIEHGRASKSDTEEFFQRNISELEDVVRRSLFKVVFLLDEDKDLCKFLVNWSHLP